MNMSREGLPGFAPEETKMLNRIPREILLLSLGGGCIAVFLFDVLTGLFVFAGGIVSATSFLWLRVSLSKFWPDNKKKKILRPFLGNYLFRLILIITVIFIIIISFSKMVFAFMVGFSTIIPVFFVEAIVALSRIKKWKN